MKEAMSQMARYNVWANRRLADAMMKQDESAVDREVPSSFPTPRHTVLHLYCAESIWLQRLQLLERPHWPSEDGEKPFTTLCATWLKVSESIAAFVEKQFNDRSFKHVVEYIDMRREVMKVPVGTALHHVFNHSTYHRGQLVTMLRAIGETKIPQTDLIHYVRTSGK